MLKMGPQRTVRSAMILGTGARCTNLHMPNLNEAVFNDLAPARTINVTDVRSVFPSPETKAFLSFFIDFY